MRYVVLLRGVNVGGNNRVSKQEFQAVLEGLGYTNVTIYLNSGNAIFSSESVVDAKVVQLALEKYFGFIIPVLVLTGEKMRAIADTIPHEWTNDSPRPDKSGQKTDILFLFDSINKPSILGDIGYKPDRENMLYVDGAVIANVLRINQLKGSLQKLIGTKLYAQMTIRNVNTVRKLVELVKSDT